VLLTKCYWVDEIEKGEMAGACTYVENKNAYRVLVRKSEGKEATWKTKA
jgi:hypothetical protein